MPTRATRSTSSSSPDVAPAQRITGAVVTPSRCAESICAAVCGVCV
ncbi:hypothetical protein HMPREF9622_01578 [Cutibacterium modestum HL037PA3]|nr:hypothetical protein HMPREF9621_01636 [Cutibacterium modestum HL037PA2]EFT15372.1 hypothetical protein HMPREF9622_01578 [Cutibacterium modestum HL037PA3]